MKKWAGVITCWLVLVVCQSAALAENERCVLCGMDISKYPHSVYTVKWKDGTQNRTCGVQCGLSLQLKHPENFKEAVATDLITNRSFDAEDGFYVFKSTVTTDMGPGFIAFKLRPNAEKFQKGFGGKVLTHEEALTAWAAFLKKKK